MLTDEDELDHAVAIFFIPFLFELRIVLAEFCELVGWHGGEPLSCLLHGLLLSCLLKYVAHVALVCEIADTFGANHVARPLSCYELIEE